MISWSYGGYPLLIGAILYLIFNPEKAERIASWFYRAFVGAGHWAEKGFVASDIQATVNSSCARLMSQAPGIVGSKLKIKWVHSESREAFLKGGEMIVRLGYHPDQHKNMVAATLAFLGKALLPQAKPYIDGELSRSLDFTVARRIFLDDRHHEAVQHFHREILTPQLDQSKQLRDDCQLLERLDDEGFLSRIVLYELAGLGAKLYPRMPRGDSAPEARRLLAFLDTIASKGRGEDVPLSFSGRYMKVKVVLVARAEAARQFSTEPYVEAIRSGFRSGADTVYLCGQGDNIDLVKRVRKRWVETKEGLIAEHHFRVRGAGGRAIPAICVVMRSRPAEVAG